MPLPDGFIFSQSSLQDYTECQRRFQLRHILHQAWPAVEVEPYLEREQMMERGSRFHQAIHQHLVGLSDAKIEAALGEDELLLQWWSACLRSMRNGLLKEFFSSGSSHYHELTLSAPIDDYRLVAKYDVIISQPDGNWIILDWKTSQNRPKRKWLQDRWQSHIYPYLLTRAGPYLGGSVQINPEQIEMIYWFANQPDQPERFSYDQKAFSEDSNRLLLLVQKIKHQNESMFPLTQDEKRCLFCTYRSLCERGENPGDLVLLEEWQQAEDAPVEFSIDLEQIGEIEF